MILPLLITLALVATATGIRIGHLLADRRAQAEMIRVNAWWRAREIQRRRRG